MTVQVVTARVKQLFATLAVVAAANPVLLEGEVWIEKDGGTGRSTGRRKVGDGVLVGEVITGTAFNDLPFEPSAGGGGAPAAHASTHATGGTDVITPNSIGAATAAQGTKADSALQPAALAAYRTSSAQDTIDSGKEPAITTLPIAKGGTGGGTASAARSALGLGSAATADASAFASAAQGTDSRTPTAHQLSHRAGGADAIAPLVQVMGDASTTVAADVTVVITSVAFTAPRVLTLPAASTILPGLSVTVIDSFGAISASNTLTIQAAGSDTINGATSNLMAAARSARQLFSNGSNQYSFDAGVLRVGNNLSDLSSPSVARVNLGAKPPKIEIFTASGTWTKEAGATSIEAQYFSGAGGGGSGRRNINSGTGNEKAGGGGGGGGGMLRVTIPASRLSATETVTIGAGGPGGAGITATLGNGNGGTQGGSTIFGPFTVPGGLPGGGGGGGSAGGGTPGGATMQGNAGGGGGAGGTAGTVGAPGFATSVTQPGGAGGGGGGGVNAASTAAAGAAGGRSNLLGLAGGTAGAVNGGAGGNGADNTNAANGVFATGSGGGSGGGGVAVSGGAGGNGGFPSGGGGGGGATETGTTSGSGGAGGAGMLIVTTYF